MIDKKDGRIAFDDSLIIWPAMIVTDLPLELRLEGKHLAIPGKLSFRLGTHSSEGREWGIAAFFDKNRLGEVWMQQLSSEMDIWDIENERRRELLHRNYIFEMFPEARSARKTDSSLCVKTHWGELSSELDLRGVQAILRVKYS